VGYRHGSSGRTSGPEFKPPVLPKEEKKEEKKKK
jgi:hypothetical protein